jgi:hypothetical protein
MTTEVTLKGVNSGSWHLYNVTVFSGSDSFDNVTVNSVPTKFVKDLAPGGNLTVPYVVNETASGGYGNMSAVAASATLYFGGTLNSLLPHMGVYQNVYATLKSTPASPTEGKSFSIGIVIKNPASVDVRNVHLIFTIPNTVTFSSPVNAVISGKILNVSIATMTPDQVYTANVTAQASSGTVVSMSSGKLTFSYSGTILKGSITSKDIPIGENVLIRYTIPIALVVVAILAAAFYVRRKAAPSAQSSQQ